MNFSFQDKCPQCGRKILNMVKMFGGVIRSGDVTVICTSCGTNFTPISLIRQIIDLKKREAEAKQKEQEDIDAKIKDGERAEGSHKSINVEPGGLLPTTLEVDGGDSLERGHSEGDVTLQGQVETEQVPSGVREEVGE